jgi:outer membrane protein TolC
MTSVALTTTRTRSPSRSPSDSTDEGVIAAAFGVALNVPIFSGGALKAERKQAADAAMAAAVEAQRNTFRGQ